MERNTHMIPTIIIECGIDIIWIIPSAQAFVEIIKIFLVTKYNLSTGFVKIIDTEFDNVLLVAKRVLFFNQILNWQPMRITTRYKAHDEKGEYHTGDVVVIRETRPLSKQKRWIVVEKVKALNS
jgi:small subunit ribosomal protein S17